MTRWPPIVWPAMSLASLLILMGLSSGDPETLIPGVALAVAVFGVSTYLALWRRGHGPRPAAFPWLIGATTAFYLVNAVVAALVDVRYAIASMLASLVPLSALFILVATMRSKTALEEGRPRDLSAEDDDPLPGIGIDDATPLGDTPEHSDAERVARPDPRWERPGRTRTRR
jgi:hypothetical protein